MMGEIMNPPADGDQFRKSREIASLADAIFTERCPGFVMADEDATHYRRAATMAYEALHGTSMTFPPSVIRLIAAVKAFLADEDAMMEQLLAEGKVLEDYGFPFPRMVELRSALGALEADGALPRQDMADPPQRSEHPTPPLSAQEEP